LENNLLRSIDSPDHSAFFCGKNAKEVVNLVICDLLNTIGRNHIDEKTINKDIQIKGVALSKTLKFDPQLIERFVSQLTLIAISLIFIHSNSRYLNGMTNIDEIYTNFVQHGKSNKRLFHQITSHHAKIARYDSWDDAINSEREEGLGLQV